MWAKKVRPFDYAQGDRVRAINDRPYKRSDRILIDPKDRGCSLLLPAHFG